jgi:hypothetical protein
MSDCEYCGQQFTGRVPTEHYRNCDKAVIARQQAAIGLARTLDDVESIHEVLTLD